MLMPTNAEQRIAEACAELATLHDRLTTVAAVLAQERHTTKHLHIAVEEIAGVLNATMLMLENRE